ncbi:MAG: thiamine pyrophosphate-binding protein [Corticimicrobacter sp.]|uniref:thiamine pyrophosphate-binding protein n=1 Tax=Corticimicrobacter sp. TaxID=2678536 RepID=UPI0032DBBF71
MLKTCVEVVVQAIERLGVGHVFGISGGPIVPLVAQFDDSNIQLILAKHEQGAAMMADGYARVSRSLGVCFATSGPGATNALTAIAAAQADSIPVLLLTGQVSQKTFGKGALQEGSGLQRSADLVQIFRSVTNYSAMIPCAEQTMHILRSALRHALYARRGAAHINLPANLLRLPAGNESAIALDSAMRGNLVPSDHALMRAAEHISTAQRPVILAGHGVNLSGAWEPLQALAEALGAPVATTLKGKGAFPEDHALAVGVFGFSVSPVADDLLLGDMPDLLLIVGSSLGEFQTHSWEPALTENRICIQIDIDAMEIGKNYTVDAGLVGDAGITLSRLLSVISQRHRKVSSWVSTAQDHPDAIQLQNNDPVLKPQAVVACLSERLSREAILFVDAGNCMSWSGQYYRAVSPGDFHMGIGMGAMGHSIPAAIGGKIAAPHRPVVALVGDAAFMMTGTEIHTAVEYGIAVIWVVLNNCGHGMVYNGEALLYGKPVFSLFDQRIDFTAMAQAMGARAATVTTLDEFDSALEDALLADAPFVIDVHVDIEQVPPVLHRRIGTLKKYFNAEEI